MLEYDRTGKLGYTYLTLGIAVDIYKTLHAMGKEYSPCYDKLVTYIERHKAKALTGSFDTLRRSVFMDDYDETPPRPVRVEAQMKIAQQLTHKLREIGKLDWEIVEYHSTSTNGKKKGYYMRVEPENTFPRSNSVPSHGEFCPSVPSHGDFCSKKVPSHGDFCPKRYQAMATSVRAYKPWRLRPKRPPLILTLIPSLYQEDLVPTTPWPACPAGPPTGQEEDQLLLACPRGS